MSIYLESDLFIVENKHEIYQPIKISHVRSFQKKLDECTNEFTDFEKKRARECLNYWKKRTFMGYWMTFSLILFIFICIEFGHYKSSGWVGAMEGFKHFWVFPLAAFLYFLANLRPNWLILKNNEVKKPHIMKYIADETPEFDRVTRNSWGHEVRRERVIGHHFIIALTFVILTLRRVFESMSDFSLN